MKLLNILLVVIGAVAIAGIALMLTQTEERPIEELPENQTVNTDEIAEFGDLVKIDYTLKLANGTVVDTTDPELGKQAGLKNYKHGPMQFILGQSEKVKGFDEAIAGMKTGSTDVKTILPSKKEFYLELNKTETLHRFKGLQRRQAFKLDNFQELFHKPPVEGVVIFNFDIFPWKYQIVNVTEKYAIGKILVKEGEQYVLPSTKWNSTVFQVYDEIVTFFMTPEENQTIQTEWGEAIVNTTRSRMFINYQPEMGQVFDKSTPGIGGYVFDRRLQVVEITDDTFTVKQIGLLEDKTLKLEVTLLDLTKDVKKVKNELVVTEPPSTASV